MKNLTSAIFLILLFCTVSSFSEETAEGFNQNPEYSLPVPPRTITPETAKPVQSAEEGQAKPAEKTEPQEQKKNDQAQNVDHNHTPAGRQFQRNSYRRETVRTEYNDESRYIRERDRDLKEWENSNSPVPQSLPRATFPLQRQSFTASKRCRKTFRSSSPRINRVRTSSCCQKTTTVKTCSSCR